MRTGMGLSLFTSAAGSSAAYQVVVRARGGRVTGGPGESKHVAQSVAL